MSQKPLYDFDAVVGALASVSNSVEVYAQLEAHGVPAYDHFCVVAGAIDIADVESAAVLQQVLEELTP